MKSSFKSLIRKSLSKNNRYYSTHLPLGQFSETEEAFREVTQQFAQEQVLPLIPHMEKEKQIPQQLIDQTFELGLNSIELPEEYGGSDANFTSTVVVVEELSKVDSATAALVDVQNTLFNRTVMTYGTKEQKDYWMPLAATNTLGSFCLSEPSCGSDAFALKTRAEDKGDHYVLNGTKQWITNSREAGVYIVMANVDPSKGYKGITAFLVKRDNPGLSIGEPEDKLGIVASSTCQVIMEDCIVPKEDILGGPEQIGKGYKVAIETLNEGRIAIGAQLIGLAQGAYDYALDYMVERKQFGRPIASFQGVEFQYAKSATQIEAGRLLVYEAARKKEAGLPFIQEAAMAKYYAAKVAEEVCQQAVQHMGGVGLTKDYRAEKYYRDYLAGTIYEGSEHMNLTVIGAHQRKMAQQRMGL